MTQLICGILRLDGTSTEEAPIRRMVAAMIPPGLPQATTLAQRGPVAMAAIRLGLRDGPRPAPPAMVEAGHDLLAADVTICDRGRLALHDGGTDAECLAAALAEDGRGLASVHGDFAIAHWRDGVLTLGRDHFGARPLLYTLREGAYLAFASLPSALLRTGLASGALDEQVAASWVLQPAPPPGRTVHREIRSVPAAHVVAVPGRPAPLRYWRLDPRPRLPFDSDPRELAEETARLMTQAVARRLPSQGSGAGHLSGGLDSSPIAVLAARALAREGRAFFGYTFGEPEQGPGRPGEGDAPLADLVAVSEPAITQVPIPAPCLLAVYADGIEPDSLLPVGADEPEEQVLRHAAGQGAQVIFSGWGGDQVVSYQGRGAQADLLRAGRLLRLWRHLRAETHETGGGMLPLFLSTALMQALPQRLREALRQVAGRGTPYLATMAGRRRLVARHRREGLLQEIWPDSGDTHRIRRDMTESWYLRVRLEAFARQGARHGVVYAYPLLDLDLVEFALKVPGSFLRRGTMRRALMRDACAGILPDAVRFAAEKPYPFPGEAARIAAARGPLLAILDEWRNNARIRDILDLEFMAELMRTADGPGAPAHPHVTDLIPAFQLAGLLAAHRPAEPGA